MKILNKKHPILRKDLNWFASTFEIKSKKMKKAVAEIDKLIKKKKAYAIAANQVGINLRFFVVDDTLDFQSKVYCNPRLEYPTSEKEYGRESCLSSKKPRSIPRYKDVDIIYLDGETGECMVEQLSGLKARIAQHEIDHLNGILIDDYRHSNQ